MSEQRELSLSVIDTENKRLEAEMELMDASAKFREELDIYGKLQPEITQEVQ